MNHNKNDGSLQLAIESLLAAREYLTIASAYIPKKYQEEHSKLIDKLTTTLESIRKNQRNFESQKTGEQILYDYHLRAAKQRLSDALHAYVAFLKGPVSIDQSP